MHIAFSTKVARKNAIYVKFCEFNAVKRIKDFLACMAQMWFSYEKLYEKENSFQMFTKTYTFLSVKWLHVKKIWIDCINVNK